MHTRDTANAAEVLTCQNCGGKTMSVEIQDNGIQRLRCASCNDLVAYTSELIRVPRGLSQAS